MEHIERAIRCLENIPPTVWKANVAVEEAITKLRSAAQLLNKGSLAISSTKLASISGDLRYQLLPLSRKSLSPSLEYMASVLSFIHHTQNAALSNAVGDKLNPWETLIVSILSGLLDFMEENSGNKIRETVANVLYPVVCPVYFLRVSEKPLPFHGELLSVVYQTLTAIVDSHPGNATKLRDQIDRKGLGTTISETKAFLALESLLDLFGSLIPSVKGGRTKRTAFIKDVFDPAIFVHTGRDIQEILEDISSPDWSLTSDKIVKILAQHDLLVPQPFRASALKLDETPLASSAPFYIDKSQFIANIDRSAGIETLCVPFTMISSISNSSSSDCVHVILQLSKPPILGNNPMTVLFKENISLSLDISKSCFGRFVEALKIRHLITGKTARDKLSKVKPIELDFQSSKKDPHVLTQERFQQLSQSWALNASPKSASKVGAQPETSPLVPHISQNTVKASNANGISLISKTILKKSSPPPSTVFLDSDGNLSLAPKTKSDVKEIVDSASDLRPNSVDGNEIDHDPSKQRSRKQTTAVSDEGSEHQPESKTPTFSDPEISSESSSTKPDTRDSQHPIALPAVRFVNPDVKGEAKSDQAQRHKTRLNRTSKTNISIEEGKQGFEKKRPIVDVELEELDQLTNEERPSKRGRHELKSPSPIQPSKPITYTRKRLPSSPAILASASVDFDEIPTSTLKNVRASGMKGKNGKSGSKVKRGSEKTQNIVQNKPFDVKVGVTTETSSSKDNCDDKLLPTGDTPKVRRSARFTKLQSPKGEITIPQNPRKVVKAPWEDLSVFEQTKTSSDPVILNSNPDDASVEILIPDVDFCVNDITSYTEPANIQASPQRPSHVLQTKGQKQIIKANALNAKLHETVIIDLTSPRPLQKMEPYSPQIAILPTKRLTEKEGSKKQTEEREADKIIVQPSLKKYNPKEASLPLPIDVPPLRVVDDVEKSTLDKINSVDPFCEDENERPDAKFDLPRLEASRHISKKIPVPHPPKGSHTEPADWDYHRRSYLGPKQHMQRLRTKREVSYQKTKQDPMQKIVAIVQQINRAVVHNIEHRFEKVTESLNASQRRMLEDTANGLQEMFHDSVQHFNDMVELEENYSLRCTALDAGMHDYIKSSEQLVQCFKDIALDHSRQSLSKTFPSTLFPKAPATSSNFKL